MSTTCRYCLKQFTRSDNRKRHEANHLQVEQRDSNEQGHSENNIFEPITPEPPSPTETTEPETGEPADLGSIPQERNLFLTFLETPCHPTL